MFINPELKINILSRTLNPANPDRVVHPDRALSK
jgi:hypothetical protein